jgi:TPR repeat protein
MYWKGLGVNPDKQTAYMWILLASTANIPQAKQDEEAFKKEMTDKDIQKATKRAVEWSKLHPVLGLRRRQPTVP